MSFKDLSAAELAEQNRALVDHAVKGGEHVRRNHAVASADSDSGDTGNNLAQGPVNQVIPKRLAFDDLSDVVCIPCGCVSGYGRPPAVGECSCQCHDTARLWWHMRPWRSEP